MFIKRRQLIVVLLGLIENGKWKTNKQNAVKTNKKIKWNKFSLSKKQMKRGLFFIYKMMYSGFCLPNGAYIQLRY